MAIPSPLPINEKPYYNTDSIANSLAADDMFDCYLEPVPGLGFVTRRRPGLKLFADLGTDAQGDGLMWWDSAKKLIAVSNGKVFDVAQDGTVNDITGAAPIGGVPVVFAEGQDTAGVPWLYLATGNLIYTKGGDTIAPSDPNTPTATHVAYLKSSFLANEAGTNRFLFTDTNPDTAEKVFSLKVLPSSNLAFITKYLRPIEVGKAWTQDLETSGGTAPITLSCAALPAGVTLVGSTLSFLAPAVAGTYTAKITATDSAGVPVVVDKDFTFTVLAEPEPLNITSSGTIGGTVGVALQETGTATGGTGVLTWSATGLPAGMSLSSAGVLSGTPTTAAETAFTVTVTDSSAAMQTDTVSLILSVAAQPEVLPGTTMTITTATLPDATVGVAYSKTVAATGAVGELGWASQGLPDGLVISEEGVISGVPTGAGISAVTLSVTDSAVTGQFDNAYWSSTDNPLTTEAKGDLLSALFVAWQEVYAWGRDGLEIWQNDGVTPYSPVPGAFSEGGIEAPYSVVIADNTVFALCVIAGARVVVKIQGRAPVVISDAIGRVLAEMPEASDAIGDLISVGGVAFYLLSFPTAEQTWAYDYKNEVWARWGYWVEGEHQQFIGQHATFAKLWNKHLIMSRVDGKIYELDRNTFDDAGNEMVSFRRTGWLNHGTYNRKVCDQFYVKCKAGMSDIGTLLLRWRDDGREEWGNYVEVPLSPVGVRDFLAKMNRFGMYRSRQYEFRLSDNTDLVLVGADVEMRGLSS